MLIVFLLGAFRTFAVKPSHLRKNLDGSICTYLFIFKLNNVFCIESLTIINYSLLKLYFDFIFLIIKCAGSTSA